MHPPVQLGKVVVTDRECEEGRGVEVHEKEYELLDENHHGLEGKEGLGTGCRGLGVHDGPSMKLGLKPLDAGKEEVMPAINMRSCVHYRLGKEMADSLLYLMRVVHVNQAMSSRM